MLHALLGFIRNIKQATVARFAGNFAVNQLAVNLPCAIFRQPMRINPMHHSFIVGITYQGTQIAYGSTAFPNIFIEQTHHAKISTVGGYVNFFALVDSGANCTAQRNLVLNGTKHPVAETALLSCDFHGTQ